MHAFVSDLICSLTRRTISRNGLQIPQKLRLSCKGSTAGAFLVRRCRTASGSSIVWYGSWAATRSRTTSVSDYTCHGGVYAMLTRRQARLATASHCTGTSRTSAPAMVRGQHLCNMQSSLRHSLNRLWTQSFGARKSPAFLRVVFLFIGNP